MPIVTEMGTVLHILTTGARVSRLWNAARMALGYLQSQGSQLETMHTGADPTDTSALK